MGSPTCEKCPAACCRYEAEVFEQDNIPPNLTTLNDDSMVVMKRSAVTGYCIALNLNTFQCLIYHQRPAVCQAFKMGATDCVQARSMMSPFQLRQAQA